MKTVVGFVAILILAAFAFTAYALYARADSDPEVYEKCGYFEYENGVQVREVETPCDAPVDGVEQ